MLIVGCGMAVIASLVIRVLERGDPDNGWWNRWLDLRKGRIVALGVAAFGAVMLLVTSL